MRTIFLLILLCLGVLVLDAQTLSRSEVETYVINQYEL